MTTPAKLIGAAALALLAWLNATPGAAQAVSASSSADTAKLPEHHGQVDAKLFLTPDGTPLPPSTPKRPLLVALGGAEGGNAWARNRWKPARNQFMDSGYAFLAIGYFGMPGTPAQLDRIALEGVHAAIQRAAADPAVDGRCIAIMGGSKGAELALTLASRYPDIKAVAALAPGHAAFVALTPALNTSSWSHHGEPLPFVPFTMAAAPALMAGDKRRAFDLMMQDSAALARALIPVEKTNGPVLLVSGKRDEMWAASEMADAMMARLKAKGFAHAHRHIALDGDHAAPTEQLGEVLAFFNTHLLPGLPQGCPRTP